MEVVPQGIIITMTQAQLEDQGLTFDQLNTVFDNAGDYFGGVYNYGEDIVPVIVSGITDNYKPGSVALAEKGVFTPIPLAPGLLFLYLDSITNSVTPSQIGEALLPIILGADSVTPHIANVTGTDAQVENQGLDFDNPGVSFDNAGDYFGGVYNYGEDIVPVFDDTAMNVIPRNNIAFGNPGGAERLYAGMPMGFLLDLTYPMTITEKE